MTSIPSSEVVASKGRTSVLLVADSVAERRLSMDLYAGWIFAALGASGEEFVYELIRPEIKTQFGRAALKLHALRHRYLTIPLAMRSAHADIVHILDPAYGHLVPKAGSARVVVTCHDIIPVESDRWSGANKLLSPGWHLYSRSIRNLPRADAVIVPTDATKRRVTGLLGLESDKVRVVPYGVDEAFHRARWKRPPSTLRLLHVGSNAWYKRTEVVADSVVLLAQHGHRVELVKAGTPLTDVLANRVISSGARLIQYGRLSTQSLAEVYSDATLLLFPSSHEGFGLPLAEAMAAGLPVVASDIDALQEVSGGHAVHVVGEAATLAATIENLISRSGTLERISDEGREWASRYRWTNYAGALQEVYAALSPRITA